MKNKFKQVLRNKIGMQLLLLFPLLLLGLFAFGQSVGDYRTKGNTSLNAFASNVATNWETYNGSSWVQATMPPSSSATSATQTITATPFGSGTGTSGTAPITLSAANPFIAVGQSVTGTGIQAGTTVAAISGTSLTLSQVTISGATASQALTFSWNTTSTVTGIPQQTNPGGAITITISAVNNVIAAGMVVTGTGITGYATVNSSSNGVGTTTINATLYSSSTVPLAVSSGTFTFTNPSLFVTPNSSGTTLVLASPNLQAANGQVVTSSTGGLLGTITNVSGDKKTITISTSNALINSSIRIGYVTIPNLYVNHTVSGSTSSIFSTIGNVFVNNSSSTNAGTGAAATLAIGASVTYSLYFTCGTMTIASGASLVTNPNTNTSATNSLFLYGGVGGNVLTNNGTITFSGNNTLGNTNFLTDMNLFTQGSTAFTGSGTFTLNGLTIGSGTTMTAPNTMTLFSNLKNNGTFTPGTGTVNFYGSAATAISGNATTFYNLSIGDGTNSMSVTSVALTVNNQLALSAKGSLVIAANNLTTASIIGGSSTSYISVTTGKVTVNSVPTTATLFPMYYSTGSLYLPITFTGTTNSPNIGVAVSNTATSPATSANTVNAQWTVTSSAVCLSTIGLQYASAGAGYTNLSSNNVVIGKYVSSSWSELDLGVGSSAVSGSGPFTVSTSPTVTGYNLPASTFNLGIGIKNAFAATSLTGNIVLANMSQNYGTSFSPSPTTNSSGNVTYSSSNTSVATVSGSTITTVGVGTTTITANQTSGGNYTATSTTAALTVIAVAPAKPTISSVIAGDKQVIISFVESNWGGNTGTFTITPSTGNAVTGITSSPYTFTGLTNGTSYTFTVTATNSAGSSSVSLASSSIIPNVVALVPSNVSIIGGNAQATLSFTPPSNAIVSQVDNYIITPYLGGVAQTPITDNVGLGVAATQNYTITGLQAGSSYTFTVAAFSSASSTTGAVSSLTSAIIPTGIYTWIGNTNGNLNTAANWNPNRTIPSTVDVLQFNGSNINGSNATGAISVSVPGSNTIAQLLLTNNANVSLQAVTLAPAFLTIGNTNIAGTDLCVPVGSTIRLATGQSATDSMIVKFVGGASANIAGNLIIDSTFTGIYNNNFYAANSLDTVTGTIINGGNIISTASTLIFGTGSPFVSGNYIHNRVDFAAQYLPIANFDNANITIQNLSGGASPSTVIVNNFPSTLSNLTFNCPLLTGRVSHKLLTGNTLYVKNNVSVNLGGNIISNSNSSPFNFNVGGEMYLSNCNFIGSNGNKQNLNVTINDSLVMNENASISLFFGGNGTTSPAVVNCTVGNYYQAANGTSVFLNNNGGGANVGPDTVNFIVMGNFTKTNGIFTTGGTTTGAPCITNLKFGGNKAQTYTNNTTWSSVTSARSNFFEISNTNGNVTLGNSTTIYGTLKLTNGNLVLGGNNLLLASPTNILPLVPSSASYIDASGVGALTINSVGSAATVIPVGTASYYSPIVLTNTTNSPNITVDVSESLSYSPASISNMVAMQWTILSNMASTANVGFQYNSGNVGAGFNSGGAVLGIYNLRSNGYSETALGSIDNGVNGFVANPSTALTLPIVKANTYLVGNPNSILGVPATPTIGLATPNGMVVSVNFLPPANSFVTQYTVTSNPGNISATGTSSPIKITGLTPGVSYSFSVSATNSVGTGLASAYSNTIIPSPNIYYISSSMGDDNNSIIQAQNPTSPWKSLAKLNSMMGNLLPGDEVLFNRGDTFAGILRITVNGALNNPIIFSAYGIGNKPVFDGRLSLPTWIKVGNNLWEASNPLLDSMPSALYINDSLIPLGRFPNINASNGGYVNITGVPVNDSAHFTCSSLTGTPNFTGADLVYRSTDWSLEKLPGVIQSGTQLSFSSPTTKAYYPVKTDYGIFFQNHPNCLSFDGDWCFQSSGDSILMYATKDPNTRNVKVANTNYSITDTGYSYIAINNLSFIGAKKSAIAINNINYSSITNCDFNKSGTNDINMGIPWASTHGDSITISNNTFSNSQGSSLLLGASRETVTNNKWTNVSTVAGMGESGYTGFAVRTNWADGLLFQYNTINGAGYDGITFAGNNVLIDHNYISNYCSVLQDGAGIYTFEGNTLENDSVYNVVISNNIVMNGIGAPYGIVNNGGQYTPACGIYLDGWTSNVVVTGNTCANLSGYGIQINGGAANTIKNNTLYNCSMGTIFMRQDSVTYYNNANLNSLKYAKFNDIENNTCVNVSDTPATANTHGFYLNYYEVDPASYLIPMNEYGTINNNIYCNPFSKDKIFYTKKFIDRKYSSNYNLWLQPLSNWQKLTGFDANSSASPVYYPLYNGLLSANLISNGTFNSNYTGWNSIGTVSRNIVSGKLDGNCLSLSSSDGAATFNLPTITAGNWYVLSMSTLGTKVENINCMLYNAQNSYHAQTFSLDTSRMDQQLLFYADYTTSAAYLKISMTTSDSLFYLDNISLYQVNRLDPKNYVRFAYNATQADSGIIAEKNYITPDGVRYASGSRVSLPSFSSIVLLKDTTSSLRYYYGGSGNLNNFSNWGDSSNGTGQNPPNFTTSGQAFYLQNVNAVTLNSNLNIGGFNSQLTVGNGTLPTVLTIPSNYTLTGTLNLSNNGTLITQNTINPSFRTLNIGSTVLFNGSVLQTIPTASYGNLILKNAAGTILGGNVATTNLLTDSAGTLSTGNYNLTFGDSAIFTPGSKLNITGGTTDFGGNSVIFQSSLSGTATLAAVTGTLLNATNVTTQRYITAKTARRYSFIGSPVLASIRNSWQQQIYISGAGSGGVTCGNTTGNGSSTDKYNTNGFDVTPTNTPSMLIYNSTKVNGSHYVSVPNTDQTNLTPGIGYCLNIRGNRNSASVTCVNQLGTATPNSPEAVTLSASGKLTSGNLAVTLYDTFLSKFTLLANPYPCTISFTSFQNSNSINTYNKMWTYSPFGNGNYTTYSDGIIANGSTGYDNLHGDYIASGQAFFVEATQTGSASVAIFQESHKTNGTVPNTQYFGTKINKLIRVGMKSIIDSNLLDEVVVRYKANGTLTYNPTFDAESFSQGSQKLVTLKQSNKLAIATHPDSFIVDTAILGLVSSKNGAFSLLFSDFEGMDVTKSITLIDNLLGIRQNIRLNPVYNFNITADTNSQGNNRFLLVVGNSVPLGVNTITLFVTQKEAAVGINWSMKNQTNIYKYEVERSTDNVHFNWIATANVKEDNKYFIEDNHLPDNTNTVFYRIKVVSNDGNNIYSNVAKFTIHQSPQITIYPNPAKTDKVNLILDNLSDGNYLLIVYNSIGEKVIENKMINSGIQKDYQLNLGRNITNGIYNVIIKRTYDNSIVGMMSLVVVR